MHKGLAETVLSTFREPPQPGLADALASFSVQAWKSNAGWLHTHGAALYFLSRVKELRLEAAVPGEIMEALERDLVDNRARTDELFAEFVRINEAFLAAGVNYVNLKGFTLTPQACADPALRLQLDLDFLAARSDAQTCSRILSGLGYSLTAVNGNTSEFRACSDVLPETANLYQPKRQRTVDMHYEPEEATRTCGWQSWRGFSFPALCESSKFALQATHLLKHLGGEWTRLNWLLEFRRSVVCRYEDRDFWAEIEGLAAKDAGVRTAIGVSLAMTADLFGPFAPPEPAVWAVNTLDPRMRTWLRLYGRKVVLADFPGTKLYLLLPAAAAKTIWNPTRSKRQVLLPLHRPPRFVCGTGSGGWRARARACSMQMEFLLLRSAFHCREGWRYLLEAPRWKRLAGPELIEQRSVCAK